MKHSNDGWDLCLCVWGTRSTPWIPPWHCCGRPWMIYNHPRSLRGFAWDSGMIFFDRWVWEWVRCFWKGHGQTTKRWVLWHRRFLAELQHVLVILTSRCYPQITKKRGVCVFFFRWTRSAFSKVSCLGVQWQLVAFGVGAQTWMSEPPKPLM